MGNPLRGGFPVNFYILFLEERHMIKRFLQLSLGLFVVALAVALSVDQAQASPNAQADKVAQGKYLVKIIGCDDCHTPLLPSIDMSKPQTVKPDDLMKLAFSGYDALDTTSKYMAGGRAFDLGPGGVWFTRNLTPDKETGLGDWTDDEIKTAIRTGKTRRGTVLSPFMPYPVFNNLAEADVDAIVAYLRTLPAVKNPVPPNPSIPNLQPMPVRPGIVAPSPADTNARGKYLMTAALTCTDCHTPMDPATGAPVMTKYLAGGQPFEGPWGIVYGGNITPHEKTGLGAWSDADLRRVLSSGVRKDGRRLIVMPWQSYANLTEQDAQAVVAYLKRGLTAVDNQVPATSVKPEFTRMVDVAPTATTDNTMMYIILGVVGAAVVAGAAFFLMRRNSAAK
jgi:mono/diheme cytochrome c family protein